MNLPRGRGAAIDIARSQEWQARFASYPSAIVRDTIDNWLNQFANSHRDTAARVLDAVVFVNTNEIQEGFRTLLGRIPGWIGNGRRGNWYFVPFSSTAGESGDSMLHAFRVANRMTRKRFSRNFIHRSELPKLDPSTNDTVVLIDDFSGTGKQACDSWNETFSELITGSPRIILVLLAATRKAIDRISGETPMKPYVLNCLEAAEDIFASQCTCFTGPEKSALLEYCKRADKHNPRGYGRCGLLFVLAHRCPNNSIPILHASNANWRGMFPR
jgi:hypothetical protein